MTAVLLATSSTGIFHSTHVNRGGGGSVTAYIPTPIREDTNNDRKDLLHQFHSTRQELTPRGSAGGVVMSQAHLRRRVSAKAKTNGVGDRFFGNNSSSGDDDRGDRSGSGSGSGRMNGTNGGGVVKRKAGEISRAISMPRVLVNGLGLDWLFTDFCWSLNLQRIMTRISKVFSFHALLCLRRLRSLTSRCWHRMIRNYITKRWD